MVQPAMLINLFSTWIFHYKNEFTFKNTRRTTFSKTYYRKECSIWLQHHNEGNLYQLNFSFRDKLFVFLGPHGADSNSQAWAWGELQALSLLDSLRITPQISLHFHNLQNTIKTLGCWRSGMTITLQVGFWAVSILLIYFSSTKPMRQAMASFF